MFPLGATEIFWRTHHWTWLVLAIEKGVPTAFIIGVGAPWCLAGRLFETRFDRL